MVTWFSLFSISLFFLGGTFYIQLLRSVMDLITRESELHWDTCPMLSSIGSLAVFHIT